MIDTIMPDILAGQVPFPDTSFDFHEADRRKIVTDRKSHLMPHLDIRLHLGPPEVKISILETDFFVDGGVVGDGFKDCLGKFPVCQYNLVRSDYCSNQLLLRRQSIIQP